MQKKTSLLKTRRFLPLFLTQFLGAFNDNVLKNALVMLIAFKAAGESGGNAQILVTMAGALFIAPYFFFSATAGQLADKYDRAKMARITKIAEIIFMGLAAVGFYIGSTYFLLFILFCMGVQATFFGPIKYALLPQHLQDDELIAGNGYIEAGTFLAILAGTILGGLLIMQDSGAHLISAAMMSCALLGYIASRFIPTAPAPMPQLKIGWNIARETWRIIDHDRKNPRVFRSILGISWFWLVGATFLSQFPAYAKDVIHADETVVTLFLTMFSVGIGVGSALCNRLLRGEVKSTYVASAAFGMTIVTIDLFFASRGIVPAADGTLMGAWTFLAQPWSWRIMFDLFAFAACAGVYVVPLYAIMQHDSEPESRARTIATNNVVNAVFMVVAAVVTVWMLKEEFTVPEVFLTVGVLNGLVALYIRRLR